MLLACRWGWLGCVCTALLRFWGFGAGCSGCGGAGSCTAASALRDPPRRWPVGLARAGRELSPSSHPRPTKAPFGYLRWGMGKRSAHKLLVVDEVAIFRCICVFSREGLAAVGAGGGSAPVLGEGAVLQTAVRLRTAPAAPRHNSWL